MSRERLSGEGFKRKKKKNGTLLYSGRFELEGKCTCEAKLESSRMCGFC